MHRVILLALLLVGGSLSAELPRDYECLAAVSLARLDDFGFHGRRVADIASLQTLELDRSASWLLQRFLPRSRRDSADRLGVIYVDDEGIDDFLDSLRFRIAVSWGYVQYRQQDEAVLKQEKREGWWAVRWGLGTPVVIAALSLAHGVMTYPDGWGYEHASQIFQAAVVTFGVSALCAIERAWTLLRSSVDMAAPKYSDENLFRVADRFKLDNLVDKIREYYRDAEPGQGEWVDGNDTNLAYEASFFYGRRENGRRYLVFAYRLR